MAKRKTKRKVPQLREYTTSLLLGLPGVTEEQIDAVNVRSVTDCNLFLRHGLPVTAAGSDGALTVWKDSDGVWHCFLFRRLATIDQRWFKHIASVGAWIKETWPRLGKMDRVAAIK